MIVKLNKVFTREAKRSIYEIAENLENRLSLFQNGSFLSIF